MKIAVLNCLKANEVCTAAGCLKAFNTKTKHFEVYKDTDTKIQIQRYIRRDRQ